MQELRLVAVSEDGTYAVLAVPGRGGRFSLPIDDRLRTVARGQFSRLAQYEIEVENPLRPKEIQDRIRAGETAEEIADAAGIPIDRIRRFEGPVLAEREYRAQEAQRATVRGHTESGPGPRLGEIVSERLSEAGAPADALEWDSRKRTDGNWQVQLQFMIDERPLVAEWVFDPRRRQVMPADDLAQRLCLPQADWPAGRLGALGAPTATVTPIGSRLHHAETRPEPDRVAVRAGLSGPGQGAPRAAQTTWSREAEEDSARDRTAAHAPEAPEAPAVSPAAAAEASRGAAAMAQAGTHAGVPAQAHPAERAGSRSGRHAAAPSSAPAPSAPEGTAGQPGATAPGSPAARRAAESAAAESTAAAVSAEAPADGTAAQSGEQRPARPARKSARNRRSSVPSWDEIMLGTSRQPE